MLTIPVPTTKIPPIRSCSRPARPGVLRWGYGVLALACLSLPGCGSLLSEGTADAAGIAGAGIASSVTKDAAVATGIGLAVRSIADAGLKYAERRVHRAEQDRIATVAGGRQKGEVGVWDVSHDFPIEPDARGSLTVAREFGGPGFACREIVFSVEGGKPEAPTREFYTATICRDGETWKWATAEPATERWGSLQ